jgi:hypothetical protein
MYRKSPAKPKPGKKPGGRPDGKLTTSMGCRWAVSEKEVPTGGQPGE